jgi:hypothetical protein
LGPVVITQTVQASSGKALRAVFLCLTCALLFPPAIGFVALGRLMAGMDPQWKWLVSGVWCFGAFACGWICVRITRIQFHHVDARKASTSVWILWVPLAMALLAIGLGPLAVWVFGWTSIGLTEGFEFAASVSGAALVGALLNRLAGQRPNLSRLTRAQRIMNGVAETGLGVGEILVQVPVWVARALGVLVWRFLGELLIDTLILGATYRSIEGLGTVLRLVHNGRMQRYTLVIVVSTVMLMLAMLS